MNFWKNLFGGTPTPSKEEQLLEALLARIETLKSETGSTDAEIADVLRGIMEDAPVPAKFTRHPEHRAILDEMLERITDGEAQFAARMVRQTCEEAGLSAPELAPILRGMFQNQPLPDRLARNSTHSTVLNSLFALLQAAAFNPAYPMACAMIPMMLDTIEGGGGTSFDDLIEYAVEAKNMGADLDESRAGMAARN